MTIASVGHRYLSSALDYIDVDNSTDVLTTKLANSSSSSGFASVENYDGSDNADGSSGASISSVGTLVSSLAALQRQDADGFAETTGDIADSLHEAADQATDSTVKYQLDNLAGRFSNASTTGSLSSLVSGGASGAAGSSASLRGYAKTNSGQGFGSLFNGLGSGVLKEVTSLVQAKLAEGIDPTDGV
jgi:hypothetical protein